MRHKFRVRQFHCGAKPLVEVFAALRLVPGGVELPHAGREGGGDVVAVLAFRHGHTVVDGICWRSGMGDMEGGGGRWREMKGDYSFKSGYGKRHLSDNQHSNPRQLDRYGVREAVKYFREAVRPFLVAVDGLEKYQYGVSEAACQDFLEAGSGFLQEAITGVETPAAASNLNSNLQAS